MGNQGFVVRGDVFVDWFEGRIIRQDVIPFCVLDLLADILPDLDGHGPLSKIAIDLANCGAGKPGVSIAEGIKGGTQRCLSLACADEIPGLLPLLV